MNESKTEYTKNCEQCKQCEFRELLQYKRAYLRLFNRVSDAIKTNITDMLKEAQLEAEDICTRDDDDDCEN